MWELGGVPQAHQTDRLTAVVHNALPQQEFTQRYQALLKHYGLTVRKTQAAMLADRYELGRIMLTRI